MLPSGSCGRGGRSVGTGLGCYSPCGRRPPCALLRCPANWRCMRGRSACGAPCRAPRTPLRASYLNVQKEGNCVSHRYFKQLNHRDASKMDKIHTVKKKQVYKIKNTKSQSKNILFIILLKIMTSISWVDGDVTCF